MRSDGPLEKSARDYRHLLDLGYPGKATLKLVGDRYRLSRDERNILFRGVLDELRSRVNREKRFDFPDPDEPLAIDGYNVICTVMNYRLGKTVFIGTDGFARDSGGTHGKITHDTLFENAIRALVSFLASRRFVRVIVVLDEPVSFSRQHARFVASVSQDAGVNVDVRTVKSADGVLCRRADGANATSDSEVIFRSLVPVWDLGRALLDSTHGLVPHYDFERLFLPRDEIALSNTEAPAMAEPQEAEANT